jgi:hypothetical protein
VVTVHGEQELFARAGHLFHAREEFVCAAADLTTWSRRHVEAAGRVGLGSGTDGGVGAGIGVGVAVAGVGVGGVGGVGARELPTPAQMRARVASGVRFHKMYTPGAVAEPADAEHLLEIAGAGVEIRICQGSLPHETIIIDRRVAIIAGAERAGERDFSVVQAPEVVAGVRSLFFGTWQGATELAEYLPARPPVVDEQGLRILRLLSDGHKDESAARSVGVSVRTYRRRVAELMAVLGADSRFQAGVRARALGLRF